MTDFTKTPPESTTRDYEISRYIQFTDYKEVYLIVYVENDAHYSNVRVFIDKQKEQDNEVEVLIRHRQHELFYAKALTIPEALFAAGRKFQAWSGRSGGYSARILADKLLEAFEQCIKYDTTLSLMHRGVEDLHIHTII